MLTLVEGGLATSVVWIRNVASGRARLNIFEFCLLCSVCSSLLEEDGGLTQETEVVEYPQVMDKGNYVYWASHTFSMIP